MHNELSNFLKSIALYIKSEETQWYKDTKHHISTDLHVFEFYSAACTQMSQLNNEIPKAIRLSKDLELFSYIQYIISVRRRIKPAVWSKICDFIDSVLIYTQKIGFNAIEPRCSALFVDEAQDMGPDTLLLLGSLVKKRDEKRPKSRPLHVFYDNDQRLYDRGGMPHWEMIGMNLQGCSTVMKDNHRNTRPICELALNVLYHITKPTDKDPDYVKLKSDKLVELAFQGDDKWWRVNFSSIRGPNPEFQILKTKSLMYDAVCNCCLHLVTRENVDGKDICIIANNDEGMELERRLNIALRSTDTKVRRYKNPASIARKSREILICTANSFKGFESEVVIIPNLWEYQRKTQIYATRLYVAMTRARSILKIFSWDQRQSTSVNEVVSRCVSLQKRMNRIEKMSH